MPLKPSELPLLVSLDVLIEECNVTRAASRLHVSQPALSAQLAKLRRLFNDPLLVPSETGRGMVPTPRAEGIATTLRDALSQLTAINQPDGGFDPTQDAATFHVRGDYSASGILALPLLRRFHVYRNPALRLAFRVDDENTDVLSQFEQGELDILLAPEERIPAALKARPLVTDTFAMVQRKDHPRGLNVPDMDEYCALSHIVVSSSGQLQSRVDRRLKDIGRQRHVMASASHTGALADILTTTDLVCTMPRGMADALGKQVTTVPLPFAMPAVRLSMAWHARIDKQPAHQWLREALIETTRDIDTKRFMDHHAGEQ